MEATTPPPQPSSHEFGPHESQIIGKAGKWIGYWSWIAILSGVLMIVGSFLDQEDLVAGLIMGVIYIGIGAYFRGAASAMSEVVSTAGNDVQHLMTALDKLSSAFKVMVLLVLIGAVAGLIGGIALAMGG
jgi:hypothetical protein